MKALFLCAGKGSRLRPLTSTVSKHLIPVANKPILFYGLEKVASAGIREVGVIVSENRSDIQEALGDGEKWGLKITYITQDNPLGLAHAVNTARDFVGDDHFMVYLGDNLLNDDISEVIEEYKSFNHSSGSLVLLTGVDNPEQFGIAELGTGRRIVRVWEKPQDPPSKLAIIGVYLFDSSIFKAIDNIEPSDRGELEITDAIQYQIDHNIDVNSYIVKKWWKDTGKPADIVDANRIVLEELKEWEILGNIEGDSSVAGRVQLGHNSRIINSRVRGPVVIGEDVIIEDSFVGPFTSIGDRVKIYHSEIEHSVVLRNSEIRSIEGRIDDSLIGRNVVMKKIDRKPRVHRFILGDNSQVELT